MKVEKLSPEQIKLTFAGPNGMALRMLAFHGNQWPLNFERFGFFAPAHYLKQFHPKYTPSITDYKLFNEKADDLNPERPAMTVVAGHLVEAGRSRDSSRPATRTTGRSIRRATSCRTSTSSALDLVENNEALNLKAINGEIDMQFRTHRHRQVLAAPGEQGRAATTASSAGRTRTARRSRSSSTRRIADPDLRPIFQNLHVPPGAVVRHQPQADQRGQLTSGWARSATRC